MSVSYFGLSFSMSTLYGNPFLNYFLLTAVELPAFFASWLAVRSFPRRFSFISFSLLGALALLLIQVTMKSECKMYKTVLSELCRMAILRKRGAISSYYVKTLLFELYIFPVCMI